MCPPKMRSGLFTTAAVDNIDYNPSSATAKDSFHGTGISLMQHPSHDFVGHDRCVVIINQTTPSTKSVAPLPSKYTNVPPTALKTKQFTVPAVAGLKDSDGSSQETPVGESRLDFLVSLPCQHLGSCDTTCCNQCSVAIVSGERTVHSNDQTFHDNCQRSCSTP